jgi:MoxR-like ATPase
LKFLHLFKSSTAATGFVKIQGYEDLKDIVRRALEPEENYNLLFIGAPASAKTLFLQSILEIRKDAVYFDGSNTTNRILDVLEEKRPKIILLDEADKLQKNFQNRLLNFMESGRVDVEQQKKQYHFAINGAKIFATANEPNRLSEPLQSRFRKLPILDICISFCRFFSTADPHIHYGFIWYQIPLDTNIYMTECNNIR